MLMQFFAHQNAIVLQVITFFHVNVLGLINRVTGEQVSTVKIYVRHVWTRDLHGYLTCSRYGNISHAFANFA